MGVTGDGVTPKLQNLPGGKKKCWFVETHSESCVLSPDLFFVARENLIQLHHQANGG